MINRIKVLLAGDVMMHLHFNEHFTNAANDLKEARLIAKEMVERYGMVEELVSATPPELNIIKEARSELESFIARAEEGIMRLADVIVVKESATKEDVKELLNEIF
ncbi:MAG: hypothetical protein L3J42_04530 [Hydrogenimonas sp.]|nr:hypothetical protein [Hydrogenimonas sp.]